MTLSRLRVRGLARPVLLAGIAAVVVAVALVASFSSGDRADDTRTDASGRGTGEKQAPFEERAAAAGLAFRTTFLREEQGENFKTNLYDHGSGVAVGDVDGDGLDDVYFCNQLGSNALFRNTGGGRFEDITAAAGPIRLADRVSTAAAFADVDNDGREDLYVTTTMGGNAFFANQDGRRFADETEAAGLRLVAHSQTATFFDADGDGLLDLLVGDTAKWTHDDLNPVSQRRRGGDGLFDLIGSPTEPNRFYRNRGSRKFEDATAASGLSGSGWASDFAVFDFDEDGDLDVFVAHMFGDSRLYENDGHGHFTDVTRRVLGKVSWGAVGCKPFDVDDDGHLDLLVVDMHSDMWMGPGFVPAPKDDRARYDSPGGPQTANDQSDVVRRILETKRVPIDNGIFGNTLYVSKGDWSKGGGRFEEVSLRANVETLWPWGVAAADFDGDGYVDAFLPSGMGFPYPFLRSPLLMNRGDGTFADRSKELGLGEMPGGTLASQRIGGKQAARSSRVAATADFDGDGRVDLLVSNFNDVPLLLMNRFPPHPWVALRLVGTTSNRDAVGAVVRLKAGGKTLTRQVAAAGGYLAQSSLALVFALGDATKVDEGEVTWPDGKKQRLAPSDLETGRLHRVEQAR